MFIFVLLFFLILPLIFLILTISSNDDTFFIGVAIPLILLIILYGNGEDAGFPHGFRKIFRKKQKKIKMIISYEGKVYEIGKHFTKEQEFHCFHVETKEYIKLNSKDKKISFLYGDINEYNRDITSKLSSPHSEKIDKIK